MRSLMSCVVLLVLGKTLAAQGSVVLTEVPIELVDGYVFLKARINGSEELNYLFDTGCSEATVDSSTAAMLGFVARERTRNYGQGPFVERTIDGASLIFGTLRLDGFDLLQRSSDFMERRLGVNIDGVVGADLLRDYVVEIDYDRMLLTVYGGEGFIHRGAGEKVAIEANRFFSTVNAELTLPDGETLSGRFLIDTGAGLALALNTPFVNENELLSRIGAPQIEYRLAAHDVQMVSHPGRASGFRIGAHEFVDMPVVLSQSDVGPLSPRAIAGIIGNRVWRRFNTVFDYSHNAVYLEPNGFFEETFRVDCSGLGIEIDANNNVVVARVIENSPAAAAGVLVGDRILSLDGHSVDSQTLHELRNVLTRDREQVSLIVGRDDKRMRFSLRLRALY